MPTFEQGFAAVEAAADAAEAAAKKLAATARRLRKAAQEGPLSKVRREGEQLVDALAVAGETATGAAASWPFAESEEAAYLDERYADELRAAAAAIGLNVTTRDEALVCSPSIVRLLPADRALTIDGKKRAAIRPSKLAADLYTIQQRMRPKSDAQQRRFLEALHKACKVIRGKAADPLFDSGGIVPLAEVYAMFTSLPGSSLQYTKTDFARDIYLLDSSGVTTTKSGARVSFPFSTAAKSSTRIFSFVDRAGNLLSYYGVQFTE